MKNKRLKTKEEIEIKLEDSFGNIYKIINGIAYNIDTPSEIVNIMETARQDGTRLRFYFGDSTTGKDWSEQYDTMGSIGYSTGAIKTPILIKTWRSSGGCGILTNCIVKIEYANKAKNGYRTLYKHEKYSK
jgi:hypothetical protein